MSFPGAYIFLSLGVFCSACNTVQQINVNATPYNQYARSLDKAGLHTTDLAQQWMTAGLRALQDSIVIDLPFSETGYFSASEPRARSYRFPVQAGQVLTVDSDIKAKAGALLFLDVFVQSGGQWQQVAYSDSNGQLRYEFDAAQVCLLRMQPELLIHLYYSLRISLTPTLINPVSGAGNRSIGSLYGAERDGGSRHHEGIDIFAPKGTPVIAPTDGQVANVGLNRLGGKVVWMRDYKRSHSYYFAHLDTQLVRPGQRLRQGDTIGLVGNTGNAATTPPHLHFGIYQSGSKDPYYYVKTLEAVAKLLPVDTGFDVRPFRMVATQTALRVGPDSKSGILASYPQHTYVQVIGQHESWYRVSLPDQSEGYLPKKSLASVRSGKTRALPQQSLLRSAPQMEAVPIDSLPKGERVETLAQFRSFEYVKTADGVYGWLE